MKIGILSDTHNNTAYLQKALDVFQQNRVEQLIHCGDMTTLDTAAWLDTYPTIYVFGNGDYASGAIRERFVINSDFGFGGLIYRGEIEGVRIAATHGHIAGSVEDLASSGEFDYVFCGHSHRRRNEMIRATSVINPGALGGLRREERSICIFDLSSREVNFILLD